MSRCIRWIAAGLLTGWAAGQCVLPTPTFGQLPGTSPQLGIPLGLVVGDFNGDGFPDFAFGEHSGNPRLYRTAGTGTAALGATTTTIINLYGTFGSNYVLPLGAHDPNGDGLDDVVCLTEAGLVNMINTGSGPFGQAIMTTGLPLLGTPGSSLLNPRVRAADLDLDGDLDVVLTGPGVGPAIPGVVNIYETQSGGLVVPLVNSMSFPNHAASRVGLGDINGDGIKDIVVQRVSIAPPTTDAIVLLGTGTTTGFTMTGPFSWPVQIALVEEFLLRDLNGDGYDDIVAYGRSSATYGSNMALVVMWGNATGVPTISSSYLPNVAQEMTAFGGIYGGSLADFDDDGALELLFAGHCVRVTPQFGGANKCIFEPAIVASVLFPSFMTGERVADVDLDGDPDVIAMGKKLVPVGTSVGYEHWAGIPINGARFGPGTLPAGSPMTFSGGVPAPGNLAYPFTLQGAPPNTLAVLGLSHNWGIHTLGPGIVWLNLAPGQPILPYGSIGVGTTDATGGYQVTLSIVNDPALLGTDYWAQWLVVDPAGPIQVFGVNYSLTLARRIMIW